MNPVFINGKCYDWGNLSWVIFGVPLAGITSINYGRKRQSVNNYGAGYEPIGHGYKNFEYEGSISVYTDELLAWTQATTTKSILELPLFSATNIFSGDGVVYRTDKLKNIRFLEDPFKANQNDSSLVQTVPFTYAGLIHG